jgi:deoxyadenosine/deoxycytidine kinase
MPTDQTLLHPKGFLGEEENRWTFADGGYLNLGAKEVNEHGMTVLVLEGNIGAGKSTLARRLGEVGDEVVRTVMEPLPPSECLSAFYADRQRHALNSQLFFLFHRALEVLNVWYAHLSSTSGSETIIVMDRGFDGDSLFAEMMAEEGMLSVDDMILYRDLASRIVEALPPPSATRLLQVPAEECLERVARRARHGEAKISLDYLARFGDAHKRIGSAPQHLSPHILYNSDCNDEEAVARAKTVLQTANPVSQERSSLAAFQRAVKIINNPRPRFETRKVWFEREKIIYFLAKKKVFFFWFFFLVFFFSFLFFSFKMVSL